MLQEEVGIDIDDGVGAGLHPHGFVGLHDELSEGRAVFGSVVFGEEAHVGSEVAVEDVGYLELHEEIGVDVECRYGENLGMRRTLIGDLVLPVEDAEFEVLS